MSGELADALCNVYSSENGKNLIESLGKMDVNKIEQSEKIINLIADQEISEDKMQAIQKIVTNPDFKPSDAEGVQDENKADD